MKKFLSIFMATIIVSISMATASAAGIADKGINFVSDNATLNTNISDFDSGNIADYLKYEFLELDFNSLNCMDTNKLMQLVDNGMVLCVKGEKPIADTYKALKIKDIPKDMSYKGMTKLGTFIFNQNNSYVYGIFGKADVKGEKKSDNSQSKSAVVNEAAGITDKAQVFSGSLNSSNVKEFSKAILNYRRGYNKQSYKPISNNEVYLQMPTKGFNGTPYYTFLYYTGYNNVTIGSVSITQYRYDIYVYNEGGVNKAVTDIVTEFTPSATSDVYVNNYNVRMHANIDNMTIIGQSYLNSNSSTSYTLSGGIGVSGTGISGSISASTTNTFSTNNQNIRNTFVYQKYKDWRCDPTQNWYNASWTVEPAIRILNTNASQYANQAYSSVQDVTWTNSSYDYHPTSPLEVGGAW